MFNIKSIITIIIFLVSFLNDGILCQTSIRQKWIVIEDTGAKVSYLDTNSIRRIEDQLSIWVMEVYRDPQEIFPDQPKANRIKTQYLINKAKGKYSIIGQLFYDERSRLIGEVSKPRLSGSGEVFSLPLLDNTRIKFILEKAGELIGENISVSDIEEENQYTKPDTSFFDLINSRKDTSSLVSAEELSRDIQSETVTRPTLRQMKQIEPEFQDKISNEIGRVIIQDPETKQTVKLKSSKQITDSTKKVESTNEKKTEKVYSRRLQYDPSIERNITNTIFSDGNLYCVQVSSWKNHSIAERELKKLLDNGHKAFIVEAQPFGERKGTWYRVRIGYFNSLDEAKEVQKRFR